jgi:hypothetical protein
MRRSFQRFSCNASLTSRNDATARRTSSRMHRTLSIMAVAVLTTTEALVFQGETSTASILATVAALQDNLERHALSHVNGWMTCWTRAYVLPDGRRVFKTEDGMRVFDEHGNESRSVTSSTPPRSEDGAATMGRVRRPRQSSLKSLATRAGRESYQYQAKLDEARERLDAGKMTREEHDRFREELKVGDARRRAPADPRTGRPAESLRPSPHLRPRPPSSTFPMMLFQRRVFPAALRRADPDRISFGCCD